MKKIGYKDILKQYIDGLEPGQPVLTDKAVKYAAEMVGMDDDRIKKAVNVNMARLEKAGYVSRISKGIYCKKTQTAFGYYTPSKESLYCQMLLYDNEKVIGYETGFSALNRIGLVSQMPGKKCIATNLYARKLPGEIQLEIRKPPVTVNNANYRYLQFLDVLKEMERAPVDTARPDDVLKSFTETCHLDRDVLILLARKYYSPRILFRAIDILLEDIEIYETARG
ncbi:MAG: DUF6088 family protein [Butyrivibrio sp.]|nr:DUF6088 family protein [Butyrivibrio sp.]